MFTRKHIFERKGSFRPRGLAPSGTLPVAPRRGDIDWHFVIFDN